MAVKRVVFMRPGETDWNRVKRWQGHVAIPLNERGRMQAERLAQFVRPIGLHAIYTSNLRRAVETAQILAEKSGTGIRVVEDKRLRERNMGEWQGLTLEEIKAWYPDEYKRIQADPEHFQIPGGESRSQVRTRIRAAFEDIVMRGGEVVGVISHTTALRLLLQELVPECNPEELQFHNMSVTTVMHNDDDTWSLSQFDDVTHLEGMPSSAFPEIED